MKKTAHNNYQFFGLCTRNDSLIQELIVTKTL